MGGQPFFYEVRNEFYKGVQGVVLVYDVTNRDSFESLEGWLCELLNHSSIHIDDMVIALCANKKDLSGHMVDDNEGQIFADSRGFLHYKTSAKTGDNVTQMFEDLVGSIVRGNGKDLVKMNYTKEQAGLVMKIKMATSNHEVLGLQQSHSSKDDVIKAFKQLAFQLHPDKNSAPGSEDAFKIICRAKDELLDNRI
jgi:DnaJ family protein C protein 27